ncbi:MAG: translation initiation factor IF-2 [Clostridia bacterium]|nr:translation initiation factor IF-2 [Clostridia bacterium]
MGKIKIHEIAKELGLTSKQIIEKANSLGIEVSSHLSSIDEDQAKSIKDSFNGKSDKKVNVKENSNKKSEGKEEKSSKNEKEKKLKDDKKTETPVIIRREVIINDEPKKVEEKPKNNRSDVGFVERKKNQDYNIVYRNKTTKPMTFSELFGIKDNKKENKKEQEKVVSSAKAEEKPKVDVGNKAENISHNNEVNLNIGKDKVEDSTKNNEKNIENKTENNVEKNNISSVNNIEKKEKPDLTESKNMEQAVRKEFVNNNGYKRNDNYNQNRNNYNDRNASGDRNRFNQDGNRNNRFQNDRNNNYNNRNNYNNNGYNNQDRRNNGENGFNRNQNGKFQRNGFNNRGDNNRNDFNRNGKRPLDDKGIDKNIKDIMSTEIVEKESQRDYNSRSIDKAKQIKFEENKGNKKTTKTKKNGRFEDFDGGKLKGLKRESGLSNMFDDQDGGMLDYYDMSSGRIKKNKKKTNKSEAGESKQKIFELKEISIPERITVKDLSAELKKTSSEVIKKLFGLGIMATINNEVDFDTAYLIASEFGVTANKKEVVNEEDILFDESEDSEEELEARPPVVVVMGHVDHGKTSLLDAIRSTNVIEGEAGGITQHIGAYKVNVNGREITFLDTPGHEAFTSMRARGAQITDIAILVVAANDGVMPQTVEAINHAKAANIPIIVAVNKIDLPEANVDKVKQELMQYELVSEEWGGDTIFVPISAKNHTNLDTLLEMVLLVADMQELKANPKKQSKGVVIEARLDKAKGPIASVLVQRGTLDVGDTVVVGTSIGRIRAMKNDKGQNVREAGPSTPVEIMGLTEVPEAGDTFYEVKNEKMAKHLIEKRRAQEREKMLKSSTVTLSNLFEKMASDELKQLNLIVKADVQGSAEAVKQSLEKLSNDEVKVKVIHSVPGAINESDVQLAKAAGAIIIGFNVRPVGTAKELADREGVEIKLYSIIYQAIEDVEAAMKGMLDPVYEEKIIGNAQVRQTFKVSSVGTIAGCFVLDGRIERNAGVRVIRDSVVIHEGKLASLKRFKDDVKEVTKGFECGVQIEDYNDIKEDDIIEAFVMEEVKR